MFCVIFAITFATKCATSRLRRCGRTSICPFQTEFFELCIAPHRRGRPSRSKIQRPSGAMRAAAIPSPAPPVRPRIESKNTCRPRQALHAGQPRRPLHPGRSASENSTVADAHGAARFFGIAGFSSGFAAFFRYAFVMCSSRMNLGRRFVSI